MNKVTESAKIRFYDVTRCGYYKHGNTTPEFGGLADVFSQLSQWVQQPSLTLGSTCTFTLDDSDDGLHTYCFDLRRHSSSGDFVFVTWNEVPSHEGTIASVNSQQSVGDADVKFSDLPRDGIPGFATYFWVIPERSVYATVRFDNRMNGRRNLGRYINEFMAKFSPNAILAADDDEEEHKIAGYAATSREKPRNLKPKFSSTPVRKPGEIEYIRQRHPYIRKLIKKNALFPHIKDERDFLTAALGLIGMTDPPQVVDEHHVKYEIDYHPSSQELDQIIASWQEEENEADTKWSDIGVQLQGEQQARWFGHSLARDRFDIEVKRQNDEIVDPESLLRELNRQRSKILGLLD